MKDDFKKQIVRMVIGVLFEDTIAFVILTAVLTLFFMELMNCGILIVIPAAILSIILIQSFYGIRSWISSKVFIQNIINRMVGTEDGKARILNNIGWIFFVLSVLSLLGILDMVGTNDYEQLLQIQLLKSVLPLPDITTIILAGIAIFLGWSAMKNSLVNNAGGGTRKLGQRVRFWSIVCIVLSFTPVGDFTGTMISAMAMRWEETEVPVEYAEIPEDEYKIYAFLGSASSRPEDVDIFSYQLGYDGHAEEKYNKYKVCGWISNKSDNLWRKVQIEFVLVDDEGNDILIDGEPVVLTTSTDCDLWDDLQQGAIESFETNVVKRRKLPVKPYNLRVKRVTRGVFSYEKDKN